MLYRRKIHFNWPSLRPGKDEWLFLIIASITPICLLAIMMFFYKFFIDTLWAYNILNVFFGIYPLIAIYAYSKITEYKHNKIFKGVLFFSIVWSILVFLSSLMVLPYVDYPILYIIGKLFSTISLFILATAVYYGFVFRKIKNFYEIAILGLISILVLILSSEDIIFYLVKFVASKGMMDGINIPNLFSLSMIYTTITLIFLYYAYKNVEGKYIEKNSEIKYLTLFGVLIFIIEYANGLFIENFSLNFELFLINFKLFIQYTLLGVGFWIYRKRVLKK